MQYIDVFVVAVPKASKEAYLRLAQKMAPVFKKCGLLRYVECWGDDVPEGKLTSFPIATQCREDETIAFGWMAWKDKEARDRGMEQSMQDEVMKRLMEELPFDGKRMIYGGFQIIADAGDEAERYVGGYVHSFCAAVPNDSRELYARLAEKNAAIFKKYGALRYVECWGDDIPEGEITSYSKATQRRENEGIVVGWTVFSDKATHDKATAEIMQDKDFHGFQEIPFDGKRLIHGGFQAMLDERDDF